MEGIIEAATTKRTGVRVGLALVFLLTLCYSYCDVSEFMAQRALATAQRLAINPTGDFEEKRVRLTPGRG